MSRPEGEIEDYLRDQLKAYGFKALKFEIPGEAGYTDRMIMRPTWSPGAPYFVEVKAPGEKPRKLQTARMREMSARGLEVLKYVDSKSKVDDLVLTIVGLAVYQMDNFDRLGLPKHILGKWQEYNKRVGIFDERNTRTQHGKPKP